MAILKIIFLLENLHNNLHIKIEKMQQERKKSPMISENESFA